MTKSEPLEIYERRFCKVYDDGPKPATNIETLKIYVWKLHHKKKSDETLKNIYSAFIPFSRWCDKEFKDLTELDILKFLDYLGNYVYDLHDEKRKYSESTIHMYKNIYRRFFIYLKTPELAELFSQDAPARKQIERDTLLTTAEIDALINAANNYRDKALISLLYESGARRGEILGCRIKHLKFDSNGVKLTFPEGKTGSRNVRLLYSASFLRSWYDNHPCRTPTGEPDQEAYLFVSLHTSKVTDSTGTIKHVYRRLSEYGLYAQIQKIADRIHLKKKANPHAFRHSRASDLAEHLTDQQLKKFLGWTQSSSMPAVYVHDVDTEKAILRMNGIEIDDGIKDTLKVGKCARCHEINPEQSSYCSKCGLPLKDESARQLEAETDTFETEFTELLLKYPGIIENLTKYKK